jgi:transposase
MSPGPARGHPGGALYPAPATAGAAGQCGDQVPPAQAPGAAAEQKALQASERDTPRVQQARIAYHHLIGALDVHRLKCVDEAGVNLAMPRRYGRAPRGERVIGTVPQHYGANMTMVGARGLQGVQAVMTVNGATDAEVFRTYVTQVLGPTLAPGAIVVLDNLSAHKAIGVQQALARRRVRLRFLPPYSPDLSPMERCLSQLKTALRAAKARTRETLETAIRHALETVTPVNAWNWFKHCGYPLQ